MLEDWGTGWVGLVTLYVPPFWSGRMYRIGWVVNRDFHTVRAGVWLGLGLSTMLLFGPIGHSPPSAAVVPLSMTTAHGCWASQPVHSPGGALPSARERPLISTPEFHISPPIPTTQHVRRR